VALSRDIDSKVLMIDCDLRRGSLASYLNVENKYGLTEVLRGECHYTQAVMPTYVPNLFVIPHGKIPHHPAELLGSKKMRRLIQELKNEITQISTQKQAYRLENSMIGKLGKFIEPVIRPLGFDWKMGISLITGAAAKEIVVSTMGVLYQTNNFDGDQQNLVEKLQNETYSSGPKQGQPVFTPVVAFAFLIFVLIYFPCIAVVAAVKKETGGWKWAVFLAFYTTALAYFAALMINQIGSLFIH
jgi:ferrous iron transport protein B